MQIIIDIDPNKADSYASFFSLPPKENLWGTNGRNKIKDPDLAFFLKIRFVC